MHTISNHSTVIQISHLTEWFKQIIVDSQKKLDQQWRRHRTRQLLAQLPDWQLRDVGISPEEAEKMGRKKFWQ